MVVKESKDVEMKDASSVDISKSTEETKKEEEKRDPELLTLEGNVFVTWLTSANSAFKYTI